MTQPQCVVLVGLQGAGKTTFYREHFAQSHEHISKDNFPNAGSRQARQALLLDQALGKGRSVVIDNTNPTPADRRVIIETARRHGARIIGYYFESTIRASIARNRKREGKAVVPTVGILATAKRMVPPTPDEGFDELYRVRLNEDGTYDVSRVA